MPLTLALLMREVEALADAPPRGSSEDEETEDGRERRLDAAVRVVYAALDAALGWAGNAGALQPWSDGYVTPEQARAPISSGGGGRPRPRPSCVT